MILKVLHWNYIFLFLIIVSVISTYIGFEHYRSKKYSSSRGEFNPLFVQRAILVYYPSNQEEAYLPEIRWLFRSWIEMIKYESNGWRTDLVIFTEGNSSSLLQLGCVVNQIRRNPDEQAQCRVILYTRIALRIRQSESINESGFWRVNISRSRLLFQHLRTYQYIDSVNIIAESYPIYSDYDVILKTDLDVFLTRPFASFLPNCSNTLIVGRGGYSTEFNTRRLGRIARDMGWKYRNLTNIGSTWYGSPYIAHRIADLTLEAILHLYLNEFTQVEREQKLAALLWPDWHYGVLSMYGTHLAVNHLVATENFDVQKGDQLFDQPTTNRNPDDIERNNRLHLHCWHTDEQFSKFQFKANKYNQIDPYTLINDTSPKGYAMRMALESRLMTLDELGQQLRDVNRKKIIPPSSTKIS